MINRKKKYNLNIKNTDKQLNNLFNYIDLIYLYAIIWI